MTRMQMQILHHANIARRVKPFSLFFCYHADLSELLFPAMSCIAVGGILLLLTNMQVNSKTQSITHSCCVFTSKYCDFSFKDADILFMIFIC